MSKSDVLTLADTFGLNGVDSTEAGIYYNEIVRELGNYEILVGTQTIPVVAGQSDYNVSTEVVRVLEVMHSVRGRLDRISENGIRAALGPLWQNKVGSPLAVTMTNKNDESFTLVPKPDAAASLEILVTEDQDDVPVWLELVIMFQLLAREYARESNHQDVVLANAAQQISVLLGEFVGVEMPINVRKQKQD